jgi:toxin ParE1/3/4
MKPRLIISTPASRDLEDIADYFGRNSGLSRSEQFITEITERMANIARFPQIGRQRDELSSGLRSLPYKQYLIFYWIQESTIEIVRVVSGYQDLTKLFEEDE